MNLLKSAAIVIVLAAIVLLNGCDQSTPAYFKIVDVAPGVNSDGFPYVGITVENTGGGAGYEVTCHVTASDPETEKTIATGEAYFASGRNISPGETSVDQAVFWGLGDLAIDQVKLVYELTWQDVLPF